MFHTPAHKQPAAVVQAQANQTFDTLVCDFLAADLRATIECSREDAAKVVADFAPLYAELKANQFSARDAATVLFEAFEDEVHYSLQAEARAERLIGYSA